MHPWIVMPIDAKKDEATPFGDVARCGNCGLGRSATLPRPEEVPALYDLASYYTHGESHMRPVIPRLIDRVLVRLAWQFDRAQPLDVDALARRLPPGGRVLDLGCGDGELLDAFHARGLVAVGVDPDPQSRAFVRGKGLTVLAGTAEQPPGELAGQTFDLVIMSHSLEHCIDPAGALASVSRLLAPQGLAYIEVPNSGCRHFETFRQCSEMFDAPRHLWFFTDDALRRWIESHGMRVDRWHFNGFTRLFTRGWREWECEIFNRLERRGGARGAKRHSWPRSLVLLAQTAFARPPRKYDSIGILASAAASQGRTEQPA